MSITIASIMKNEAAWLPRWLECVEEIADQVVVVDNGSTDATADILRNARVNMEVIPLDMPMEGNEWKARKFLWDEALRHADEWILHLDADQCLAGDPTEYLTGQRVGFRIYDMWSETQYRDDAWWRGHTKTWWNAVNVKDADLEWEWNERAWHSGHLPKNIDELGPKADIPDECSILHYGYATPELRMRHSKAYESEARELTQKEKFHASTILYPTPRLVDLHFDPRWRLLG